MEEVRGSSPLFSTKFKIRDAFRNSVIPDCVQEPLSQQLFSPETSDSFVCVLQGQKGANCLRLKQSICLFRQAFNDQLCQSWTGSFASLRESALIGLQETVDCSLIFKTCLPKLSSLIPKH